MQRPRNARFGFPLRILCVSSAHLCGETHRLHFMTPTEIPTQWIRPDWPAPSNVRAFVTTRHGGVSTGEHASMNLGLHSGDERANVEKNRAIVRAVLPSDPRWMKQGHGIPVAALTGTLAAE